MRVLAACSLGGAGHWQPLVPLLDAARARGDDTRVIAPPGLAGMVEGTGHPLVVGGEPPEAAVAPILEKLPVVSAEQASVLANRELFARLATTAMLPTMEGVLAEWRPDVVLRDPCEYASSVIAHGLGIPTAQVAIGMADVEWSSIDSAAPALEAHRPGLVGELRASPYLTRFPASVDPSRFPDTRRFAEAIPVRRAPLPDWWGGSEAPLVYVSFGTVLGHMSLAADAYRTALRAVAGLDARVLLTVGRQFDASQLWELPANVHVESWVDQADALAGADVVVCHGGSGTTFGALAVGVPLVVVSLFADQVVNGERVARTGAGVSLDTGRDIEGNRRAISAHDAPRIAEGIGTVRAQSSYRQRAQLVAAEMAAAPSVDTLLDALLATL